MQPGDGTLGLGAPRGPSCDAARLAAHPGPVPQFGRAGRGWGAPCGGAGILVRMGGGARLSSEALSDVRATQRDRDVVFPLTVRRGARRPGLSRADAGPAVWLLRRGGWTGQRFLPVRRGRIPCSCSLWVLAI